MLNNRLGYHHTDTESKQADIILLSPVAQDMCRLMSDNPFITQQEISVNLNIDLAQHKAVVEEIRNNSAAQDYILYAGTGSKYWINTIKPLLVNGSLHAAINREYMYPNRIGLYTGTSCMFYCNFCGRNPVAKYEKKYQAIGFDVFKQIIDQDEKTDPYWENRFRISGGLEPLTNPWLGNIIKYGTQRGYRMQLYTNGFLMTDHYINEHPGVLDCYATRFSLYGVDAESAFRVTRHDHSFDNIIKNIISYINATTDTKVGLNWIILPGHSRDVLKLIDVVDYINSQAIRPVDFITVREDHSQNVRVISDEERNHLMEIFNKVMEFKEHKWPTTHWDFGYALDPLLHGKNLGGLEMVSWKELVPEGFPQVANAVDCKGDLYLYHESGFLDRPGSDRYIIGNIIGSSVAEVVRSHVESGKKIRPMPPDVGYLDAFDHVVSKLINQARDDAAYGIPWESGPVLCR